MDLKDTIEVQSGRYEVDYIMENGVNTPILKPKMTEELLLSSDPYQEMIEKASEIENFKKTVATQEMISDYLRSRGLPTISEEKSKNGKTEILGILTTEHKIVLQRMIGEMSNAESSDFMSEKKKNILGVLSDSEKAVVDMLVSNYIASKESSLDEQQPKLM